VPQIIIEEDNFENYSGKPSPSHRRTVITKKRGANKILLNAPTFEADDIPVSE